MSLISDFGDLNKDFGLRILVTAKELYFWTKFKKNEENVTNQENKLVLSLFQYVKLMYKIWGQSEVK